MSCFCSIRRAAACMGWTREVAFAGLPPFPDHIAAHLCRLVLMQALPAVAECDLARFGSAIRELQAHVGDYFAPRQGGHVSAAHAVGAGLDLLDREGAHGIGQSSWGPTGFAFAASAEDAHRLVKVVRNHPGCRGLDIRVCAALNRGADIKAHAAAGAPAGTAGRATPWPINTSSTCSRRSSK